jgi:hypothetical protein
MRSTITLVWNQMRPHDRCCGGIVTASRLAVSNRRKPASDASVWPTNRDLDVLNSVSGLRLGCGRRTRPFFGFRAGRLHHARSATELYFVVRLESRFRGAHDVLHPGPSL